MNIDPEKFGARLGQIVRDEIDRRLGTARPPKPKMLELPLTHVMKFVSSGKRTIRGIASTDSLDRQGDRVDPRGGKWQTPLPLLFGHDSKAVIGAVRKVEATARGIEIEAEVAEGIPRADEVWRLVEMGGLSTYSIGFIGERGEPIPSGVHWREWTLVEISIVPIPANADARIERSRKSGPGAVKLMTSPSSRGAVKLVTRGRA